MRYSTPFLLLFLLIAALPARAQLATSSICRELVAYRDGRLHNEFESVAAAAEQRYSITDQELAWVEQMEREIQLNMGINETVRWAQRALSGSVIILERLKLVPVVGDAISIAECTAKGIDAMASPLTTRHNPAVECTIKLLGGELIGRHYKTGKVLVELVGIFEYLEATAEEIKAIDRAERNYYRTRKKLKEALRKAKEKIRVYKEAFQAHDRLQVILAVKNRIDGLCSAPPPPPPTRTLASTEHACTVTDRYVTQVKEERGTHCGMPESIDLTVRNDASVPMMIECCFEKTATTKDGQNKWSCGLKRDVPPGKEVSFWACRWTGNYRLRARVVDDYGNRCLPHEKGTRRPIVLPPHRRRVCDPGIIPPCFAPRVPTRTRVAGPRTTPAAPASRSRKSWGARKGGGPRILDPRVHGRGVIRLPAR